MFPGYRMKIKVTLIEEQLGTACSDPDVHAEFIASKAPDAMSTEEEVVAIGVDEVIKKGKTIFPRTEDGKVFFYDYQFKGMFKDACSMLFKCNWSVSSKISNFKKVVDGMMFVEPRQIIFNIPESGVVGDCQRPLRADTAQGPRVCLANSETVPAGSSLEFEVFLLNIRHRNLVVEWLDYGFLRGLGQWRNSGKGRFTYEILSEVDERKGDWGSEKVKKGKKKTEVESEPQEVK
jgi:hypothetical protein